MSKAAKLSIIILMVPLLLSLGYNFYVLTEKKKVEEAKAAVEGQLAQATDRENKQIVQIRKLEDEKKSLNNDLQQEQGLSGELREKVQAAEKQVKEVSDKLNLQMDEIEKDRDGWKSRVERITKERDDLLVKIQNMPATPPPPAPGAAVTTAAADLPTGEEGDEDYWAQILKEKAQLEVEIDKLKDKMSADSVQMVELKQKNQQLEMKLDALESEKTEIETDIYDKGEMVNRLSLELARAKNDRKYEETQVTKLKEENLSLRSQMRDLVNAKNALEKSILNITQDKVKMEKKLGQTETIIQSKIDEIWDIKESIDQSFKDSQVDSQTANEVELPPIVVKTEGEGVNYAPTGAVGFNGRVVSVNDENNFVIVDVGETQGLRLGDALSVYRDAKYIARLEVIQVRKDIAAADIKDQWSKVRVGDVIR